MITKQESLPTDPVFWENHRLISSTLLVWTRPSPEGAEPGRILGLDTLPLGQLTQALALSTDLQPQVSVPH